MSVSTTPRRKSSRGGGQGKGEQRTSLADLVLHEDEDGRHDHDAGDEQVDVVPLAVPVGPHGRAEQRHDRDGRRALREVVDVGHAPRLGADGDLVLHPERHERVGPDALELAADNPAHDEVVSTAKRLEHPRAPQGGEEGAHQMSDMTHHRQFRNTRRKAVRSSLVSGFGGRRATARSRSARLKTIERLRSGVSGKKR